MIVALTGASGFLGRSITRALRDAGCALRAIVRRPAAIDGADVVVAALERGDALTRAVDGAEVVVHAAGGGRAARREDFLANNLGTTEALLDAIAAAPRPPRRLILISSLTAGGPDGNDAAGLADPRCRARSLYGESKWLAERACLARAGSMEVVVLRVPAVYGPGDDRFAPLVRATLLGLVPLPGADRPLSMIDVDDCARAIAALATRPVSSGSTYWIEDGERYSPRRMVELVARQAGVRVRVVGAPAVLLAIAARIAEWRARRSGVPAYLTRDKLRDLLAPSWLCSGEALRRDLGFAPRSTFASRLPEILAAIPQPASASARRRIAP